MCSQTPETPGLLGRVCDGNMFDTCLLWVLLHGHVWQIEAGGLSSATQAKQGIAKQNISKSQRALLRVTACRETVSCTLVSSCTRPGLLGTNNFPASEADGHHAAVHKTCEGSLFLHLLASEDVPQRPFTKQIRLVSLHN